MEWQNFEYLLCLVLLKVKIGSEVVFMATCQYVCENIPIKSSVLRHDDEARDLALKPEWNQYTPQFGPFFENDPVQSSKCPYSRHR